MLWECVIMILGALTPDSVTDQLGRWFRVPVVPRSNLSTVPLQDRSRPIDWLQSPDHNSVIFTWIAFQIHHFLRAHKPRARTDDRLYYLDRGINCHAREDHSYSFKNYFRGPGDGFTPLSSDIFYQQSSTTWQPLGRRSIRRKDYSCSVSE